MSLSLARRWCEIVKAPALVGRTDNAIKNRFYSLQRRMKARQCGGVRHGRRPAKATESEEEEREPPSRADRIVAIATELAFATDECERDRLIEQLTTALHEESADGCDEDYDNDDASDLGPLESPSSLAQLSQALHSHMDAGVHPSQPFEYDADGDAAALLDQIEDPPTPLPQWAGHQLRRHQRRQRHRRRCAPLRHGGFWPSRAPPSTAEAVHASVSAVADLLHLPHSPRQGTSAGATGLPTTRLPPRLRRRPSRWGGARAPSRTTATATAALTPRPRRRWTTLGFGDDDLARRGGGRRLARGGGVEAPELR